MPALIPANAKKGLLVLNLYSVKDFILIIISVLITVGIYFSLEKSLSNIMIALVPLIITVIYTMPIPNYQNLNRVIKKLITFYKNNQRYYWKGWCINETFKEE